MTHTLLAGIVFTLNIRHSRFYQNLSLQTIKCPVSDWFWWMHAWREKKGDL